MQQTWEMIPKSQDDNTLIAGAIAGAIVDHNNDVDAHLGPDQAIQSHRAAAIIDHIAESVVNDKIRANARTYIAIVDPAGDGDFTNIEDACDYAFDKGGGSIYIKAGSYSPTRTLRLRYGIDLYGEGPNETSISMVNASFKGLNVTGDAVISTAAISWLIAYTDSHIMEVALPGGLPASVLANMHCALPFADSYFTGAVSAIEVEFFEMSDGEYSLYDVEVRPTVEASVSSDIIHVNGWELVTGLGDGAGLDVWLGTSYVGQFASYLGSGDIQLVATSAINATRVEGLQYKANGGRMSVVQGVSIDCDGSNYFLTADGARGRLYIRDAEFNNVRGFFKTDQYTSSLEGAGVTIEDTNIIFDTGSVDGECSGATLRNCTFTLGAASGLTDLGGDRAYFENCYFQGGLTANINYLVDILHGSKFNGCTFANMCDGNIVNNAIWNGANPGLNVLFVGCEFRNSSASDVMFTGNNINVSGCRIFTTGVSNVGIATGSKYCLMSGCQGRGTLSAAPATCVITGNNFVTLMT